MGHDAGEGKVEICKTQGFQNLQEEVFVLGEQQSLTLLACSNWPGPGHIACQCRLHAPFTKHPWLGDCVVLQVQEGLFQRVQMNPQRIGKIIE